MNVEKIKFIEENAVVGSLYIYKRTILFQGLKTLS
jgi:hypothetical protein